jgi:hypothetical protein
VTESTDERRTMSTDTELTRKLQELVDRNEIVDCLTRYTRGMDRQDRELVRSAYHDDATDLHRSLVSDVDEFLEWTFAYHAKQSLHQHYIMNHTIEIDGDTAHAETYYLFVGSYPDREAPFDVAGGRYIDRFERRNGRWAIAARVCTAEWETSFESKQRGRPLNPKAIFESLTVTRDPGDVSYQRPLTLTPRGE